MTNTLTTVQKFSKAGRIISKIVFILCVIFSVICFICVCTTAAGLGMGELFKIGGVSIIGLIEKETGGSIEEMQASIFTGFLSLASSAVLAKFCEKYFVNELAAGTPFTFEGAREMRRLGILLIAVPLGVSVFSEILLAITNIDQKITMNAEISASSPILLGIVLIAISFVFKYGAELKENNINSRIKEDK